MRVKLTGAAGNDTYTPMVAILQEMIHTHTNIIHIHAFFTYTYIPVRVKLTGAAGNDTYTPMVAILQLT